MLKYDYFRPFNFGDVSTNNDECLPTVPYYSPDIEVRFVCFIRHIVRTVFELVVFELDRR